VAVDGDWIGELDLLTICTHHSELQAIAALSLITLYKSPQLPLSHFLVCCVSNSRSLATSSNSRDSSASRCQVLLSQPPVQDSTQHNYSAISFEPPLQSSTELPTLKWTELNWTELNWTELNWTGCPSSVLYNHIARTASKHRSCIVACVFVPAGTCLLICCSETAVCLFAYCIATAVLVVCFEVSA
jgi:hypothetical protein